MYRSVYAYITARCTYIHTYMWICLVVLLLLAPHHFSHCGACVACYGAITRKIFQIFHLLHTIVARAASLSCLLLLLLLLSNLYCSSGWLVAATIGHCSQTIALVVVSFTPYNNFYCRFVVIVVKFLATFAVWGGVGGSLASCMSDFLLQFLCANFFALCFAIGNRVKIK